MTVAISLSLMRNAVEKLNERTGCGFKHYVVMVHPATERLLQKGYAQSLGSPIVRHPRIGGIRGRRKALHRAWHPRYLPRTYQGVERRLHAAITVTA